MLIDQHKVYDDEAAVIQTDRQARTELETLFEADLLEQPPKALNPEEKSEPG
ncbi:hypothetical protein [Oceanisphaera arctica]|uniref:hypothetical protein n=1 Tax=Oceanisphaera arctica TaxID=641510 RepID=UPI0019B72EE5|nr:hypothetical protein [Oceanisphaera arctica]GHA09472.1 hypothetical protein GCM10007082_07930 [Oceanisphaera arctica]